MLYLKPANYEDIEKEWLFQRSIPADAIGYYIAPEYRGK